MAKEQTFKATITIKAESLAALVEALDRIAVDAQMQLVQQATVSTSLAIEADDMSDLITALGDIAGAVARSEGIEAKVSAPMTAWHDRRIDPTPMERMINDASDLFPGKAKSGGEKVLDWLVDRELKHAGDENLFEDE